MNPHTASVLSGFTTTRLSRIDHIVSDAQSGAARGALDAAIWLGISHGGWCAADRIADDGELHQRYGVRACKGGFGERCARNIRHSDGTLLLSLCRDDDLDGRTAYARDHARKKHKASGHVRVFTDHEPSEKTIASVRGWLTDYKIGTLHVTGPLEVKEPGLAEAVKKLLIAVLANDGAKA